jgi:hypothetical protein
MQQKLLPLTVVLASVCALSGRPEALSLRTEAASDGGFDRAQTLVVNLNKKQGSSGYYLLEGLRFVDTMDHDILKALRQVQAVEKTYAGLRGHSDSRYFELTELKIEKAIASNASLRTDLRDAYTQLKNQIKDTLVMDEVSTRKPRK